MKKLIYLTTIILFFISCEKELDISDFSDDFSFYNPELRIEAIIYPTENSALVRIDQSVRIDEADIYNCLDEDLDWNYYYSALVDSSYESLSECQNSSLGGSDCTLHLYECFDFESEEDNPPLWTFPDKESCQNDCPHFCVTDDTGSDGILTQPNGVGPGQFQPDEDGSENNGQPDCNEPNVDEYNEILPNIHDSTCVVKIINNGNICNLDYREDAGKFFEFSGKRDGGDFEVVNYGGFIPESDCGDDFFQNYDTEYELKVECPEESTFSYNGPITATDTLKRPPVAFHPDNQEEIINCSNAEDVFECLSQTGFSHEDILIFLTNYIPMQIDTLTNDTLFHEDFMGYLHNLPILDSSIIDTNLIFVGQEEALIPYSALYETRKFQSVQYFWDYYLEDYVYLHGHPDGITDSGDNFFNNEICILNEVVVLEQVEDSYLFKYDIYTFSEGIDKYYFYDLLDIADPVRTNIKDGKGNPVMGGFGSMASETIKFLILTPEDVLSLFEEED